jgi:uncharacterized protein YjiS (DUF1127 family)
MLSSITSAIHRSRERAGARRAFRQLQEQSDHILRDMGLTRDTLYDAVVGPRAR